jgi:ABC-type amino acid transport substrate-binding protein
VRLLARVSSSVAAVAAVAVLLTACGGSGSASGTFTPATKGVLTVATSDFPQPGFWEGTPAHPTGGFEYAFAQAIARRLGLDRVAVRVVPFPRLVAGDLAGADIALSLLTPTAARERHLSFSSPYMDTAPTAVVRAGDTIPSLYAARRLRWGAKRATTLVHAIEDHITPAAPVRVYDTDQALETALRDGRVDAIMQDLPLAVATADASHGRFDVAAKLPQTEGIAAALPSGSDNTQAVSAAIRGLDANGTTNDLLTRWIGPEAADTDRIPLLRTNL